MLKIVKPGRPILSKIKKPRADTLWALYVHIKTNTTIFIKRKI
jgi:hypothetical protein